MQQFQQQAQIAQQQGQPPQGQPPQEQPSVQIDQDVDNHQVEAAICKTWLISSAGRLAKRENPNGYKNVLLHMKAHLQIIQQQMQAQQLHQDQMQLATGAETKIKQPSGEVQQSKPKSNHPEKIKTGAQGADRSPIS
jgi:hypothetical protein